MTSSGESDGGSSGSSDVSEDKIGTKNTKNKKAAENSDCKSDLTPDGCERVGIRAPPFPCSQMVWDDEACRWKLRRKNSKEGKNKNCSEDSEEKCCCCQPCGGRKRFRYCPIHGWGYNGTDCGKKQQAECCGNSKKKKKSSKKKSKSEDDNCTSINQITTVGHKELQE
ncbi:unnamed protein product [Allacma fusca]|uniref:Uncharacterized protein n=1 Tax=Allacma fusca TaxID=39272 RepID=A0A8J2KL03_9HEXA|nr:unnamed protein product [Allacma fusca]